MWKLNRAVPAFSLLSLLALLSLAGCGHDDSVRTPLADSGSSKAADECIGVWSTAGTMTVRVFTGEGPQTAVQPATGHVQIARGQDADLIVLGSCPIPASVTGNVATLRNGFTCSTQQDGVNVRLTFNSGTLTRAETALQFNAGGTLQYAYDGSVLNGEWTMQQLFTRITR